MKKLYKSSSTIFLVVLFSTLIVHDGFGWGFFAHKWINGLAVETLPSELRPFFAEHQEYLSEHAIDPDLWRRDDPDEGVRHYINIDLYGDYPFDALPRQFEQAVEKFGEETVNERGIAPWIVVQRFERLIQAMQESNQDSILVHAAALGHYVADLHMPLHTVENYDGQLTGNDGIHSRFERWMIEKHADDLKVTVDEVTVIDDPLSYIFEVTLASTQYVDVVLQADDKARHGNSNDDSSKEYSDVYYSALYQNAGAVAEARMSAAVQAIGSFWYTAWMRAGKPDLN